jgi:hypothetical protein
MTTDATTLLIQVRDELRDTREPFLVSDTQICRALTQAQNELARSALCFPSTRNLSYTVLANTEWVDIDPTLIRPRAIYVRGVSQTVEPITVAELQERLQTNEYGQTILPDWRTATGTFPQFVVTDIELLTWRLVPIPTIEVVLDVLGWVYPDPIELGGESPLPAHHADGLVHGASATLLAAPDIELFDPRKVEYHQMMWMDYLSKMRSDTKAHTRPSQPLRQRKGYW